MISITRIFQATSLLFLLSASFLLFLPKDALALDPLSPSLFKCPGSPAVYELSWGQRRLYKNESVFYSHHADFSGVVEISCDELHGLPLGTPMTYAIGSLIKLSDNPRVYHVTGDSEIEHIPDEETAMIKFGIDWWKNIHILDAEDRQAYTEMEGQKWTTFTYPNDVVHPENGYPELQPVAFSFAHPSEKTVSHPMYCYTSLCHSIGFMFSLTGSRTNVLDSNLLLDDAAIAFFPISYKDQLQSALGEGSLKNYGTGNGVEYTNISNSISTEDGQLGFIGLSGYQTAKTVFVFTEGEYVIALINYDEGFSLSEFFEFVGSIDFY